jgi:hypothetical protein
MLAGVARYLEDVDAWILPVGLEGSELLFPVEDAALHPATVVMRVGRPFRAKDLIAQAGEDRRVVMDAVGLAIAELVSSAYRGAYTDAADFPGASAALSALRK